MLLESRSASEEPEEHSCTLEEIERSQKDLLEQDLQEVKQRKLYFIRLEFMVMRLVDLVSYMNFSNVSSQSRRFSRQVEDFCQNILKKSSVFSQDECQDLIESLIQTLVATENHLRDSQEAELKVQ